MPHSYPIPPASRFKTLGHFGFGFAAALLLPACSRSNSQNSVPAAPPPASTPPTASDYPAPPPPAPGGDNPAPSAAFQALPPLDQLLAPVALYPDPLIALLLPAATYPADLQAAAGFLAANGDPGQIGAQSWDDSVKDLAHYPEVVQWMNSNPDWTQQVGAAFANSPTDVMNAIQDLRARAKAAGTLTDTPQEAVVVDGDDIDLEPAQPDVIYVPQYDPDLVYFGPGGGYYGGPYFNWGNPYPMGIWLGFAFDWHNHGLWAGNWYQWHRDNGGWRQPFNPGRAGFAASANARAWHPPAGAPRAMGTPGSGPHPAFARPQPMAGAPRPAQRRPESQSSAPIVRFNQTAPVRPSPAPVLRPDEERSFAAPRSGPAPERAAAPEARAPREEPARAPERADERPAAREGERPAEPAQRPEEKKAPERRPAEKAPDDQRRDN